MNMTVCCYHVTYAFQSGSTLYICLNVKELLDIQFNASNVPRNASYLSLYRRLQKKHAQKVHYVIIMISFYVVS